MDDDDAAVVPLRGKRTTTDGRRNPSKDQQLRRESEALALRIAGATFDEVAHAIAYLASPLSGSTTGTVLTVDGGMSGLRLPT